MRWLRIGVGVGFVAAITTTGSLAQDTGQIWVTGSVVDGSSGAPLVGARVFALDEGIGVLTGDSGTFRLALSPLPEVRLRIDQLGYAEKLLIVPDSELAEPLTIRLDVNPLVLEGLDVVVARQGVQVVRERLDRRRRAYVDGVRTIPPERMLSSAAASALDFIRGFLPPTLPCDRGGFEAYCLQRRGRRVSIKVCIDERRPPGGVQDLVAYNPEDLDSVEIYDGGRLILVYTRRFMERAMTRSTWIHPFPELVC